MSMTLKPIKSKLPTRSILLDHIKQLLGNQKTGGSRKLFLPENDFQTSSTLRFPKISSFSRYGNQLKRLNSDLT